MIPAGRFYSRTAVRLVWETIGTKNFLKFRTSETDKIRCSQKYFETFDIPCSVVVSVDEG